MSSSVRANPKVSQWLRFAPDGQVLLRSGKVEIGQRIHAALARIAADELYVSTERVQMAVVDTATAPNEGYTAGSNSTQDSGQAIRLASATAREAARRRAAVHLAVSPAAVTVEDGLFFAPGANERLSYADLLGPEFDELVIDTDVALKPADAYEWVGRSAASGGFRELITGRAGYVHDMICPDMLHARVVRPPHYHAELLTLGSLPGKPHDSSVNPFSNTHIVRDGTFLAVVDPDEYVATRARVALFESSTWSSQVMSIPLDPFVALERNRRESLLVVDGVPRPEANIPTLAASETALDASYRRPYQMHGSIGPSAALAHWHDGVMTVWSHAQGVFPLRAAVAEALGLDIDRVRVIHALGSGCYGHNGADDAAFDAALVAFNVPGKPILLKWTREDEHAWEPYTSCMLMSLQATLDDGGVIQSWSHETYSDTHVLRPRADADKNGARRLLATRYRDPPLQAPVPVPNLQPHGGIHRNAEPLYSFESPRIVKHLVYDLPLRVSALRTLGAFGNVFAIESFMDEVAHRVGAHPLEFRVAHLDDPRAIAVVERAMAVFDGAERAPNRGRGFAFARYKNVKAYCGVVVELNVRDDASIALHRATIIADAGEIVDPDGLVAQLEGGFLQAASWTLYEAVTYDERGITSRDWDRYPILRFDNVPFIDTVLIARPECPFLGAGEASSGPTGPAIANAIFDAVGVRSRDLPLTPERLRAAALEA